MWGTETAYPAVLSGIGREPEMRDKRSGFVKRGLLRVEGIDVADQRLASSFSSLFHGGCGIRLGGVRSILR